MIRTSITQNCTVFFLRRELSQWAIYGSQNFDSHKWPTVLLDEVKRNPRNFEAYLCRSLCSTFTTSFEPYMHFITNGYKKLFIDQLDRSKATCSFNNIIIIKLKSFISHVHVSTNRVTLKALSVYKLLER